VRCKVVKNKTAAPFRQAEFDIMFTGDQHGINREGDILDLAAQYEVVKKLGAFYSYGDLRLGQGRQAAGDYLRQNAALCEEIETKVRAVAGIKGAVAPVDDLDDDLESADVEADALADV
jgi:recombination protein RecA